MLKRAIWIILILLINISLVQAAVYIRHVHIWWYKYGQQQEMLYLQPYSFFSIDRDSGNEQFLRTHAR